MSRDGSGERTFDTVRGRYRDWFGSEDRGFLPGRTIADEDYTRNDGSGGEMLKLIATGIGVGIGLVLLALAALSYWNGASWSGFGRDGAAVGYTLVGVFLTVAGLGAVLSTLNHNFRVAAGPGGHH